MAEVLGLDKLVNQLQKLAAKAKQDSTGKVVVGYTASYAIYVHEDMEMKWRGKRRASGIGVYWGPHGQSKFLEQPFREMSSDGTIFGIVKEAVKQGKTLIQGLLLAGLRLQRESQKLVPVEYGNLKASAFTRIESE